MIKSDPISKYEEVFTPSSPVLDSRFVVGREQEKKDLKRILQRRGQHGIVIGDRGVGKTTLVKHVLNQMEQPTVWHPASPNLSYDKAFKDLLLRLNADINEIETTREKSVKGHAKADLLLFDIGAEGQEKTSKRIKGDAFETLNPWMVFQYLARFASDAIIVIDEYDALSTVEPKSSFHDGIAYTMKHLGDHNDICNARLIIVGVAFSAEALLGKHDSVRRNAKELFLTPLRYSDIYDFLDEAEDYLKIQFERRVKERIARGSMGYPYFFHLIGLEAIDSMLARNKDARTVTWDDFSTAVNNAVESEMRDFMQKYKSKSTGLTKEENTILVELTWWKEYGIDRLRFLNYLKKKHEISFDKANSAIMQLAQMRKFIYLSRHKDDIRFRDPLMKAFLREKIFTQRKFRKDIIPKIEIPK